MAADDPARPRRRLEEALRAATGPATLALVAVHGLGAGADGHGLGRDGDALGVVAERLAVGAAARLDEAAEVFRTGPRELALLLPGLDGDAAGDALARVLPLACSGVDVGAEGGSAIAGIASSSDPTELVERALRALAAARAGGAGDVVVLRPEPGP